jgi:Zn-dependent M32 family carboxypeptidase
MYWWDRAAESVRNGAAKRFGLIATNSLRQTFNRRVLENHMTGKNPLSLVFAVPDHPWVDSVDGADVRISMTVGQADNLDGLLSVVVDEKTGTGDTLEVEFEERRGKILADLTSQRND